MSLHGLLDAVVTGPRARRGGARPPPTATACTWTWSARPPPGPSPSPRWPAQTGRTVLAVTATGREAEDLAAALRVAAAAGRRRGVPVLGDAAARAALARARTPSGRRLAVLRRLAHPSADDPARRAGLAWWSRRCARVLQPQVKGLGDLEPVALRSRAERRPGRGRRRRSRPPRTPGSSWSRSAASSPCAAASWTSSRRPRSTRCGWSSGATTSRRSATSRSPTSGRWRSPSTGCGRRPAVSCCSPTRCGTRAAALAEEHPELGELLGKIAEGIAVEGMESLAPVLVDDMELLLDVLPDGHAWPWSATRSGCGPGRATWWRTSAGVPAGVLGGDRGRRRGARSTSARPRCGRIADVRDRARELGMMWWSVSPVRRRRATDVADATGTPSSWACTPPRRYRGDTARALADTKGWLADGWRTVLRHRGHGPAARTVEVLGGEGIAARLDADLGRDRARPSCTWRAARSTTASSTRRSSWPCSPRPTCPARRRPARTARGCRPRRRKTIDPLHPGGRRLHRPRAARRRPLHRDGAAHRAGRHPRVPGRRVRPRQARPARRPALRPHRPAGAGHQVRRRRGARPCTGWAAPTGRRPRRAPRRRSRRSPPT